MIRPDIPALTGLRFVAAAFILGNHLLLGFVSRSNEYFAPGLGLSGLFGMDLFFILSGFIIHYNYGASLSQLAPRSILSFLIARFARLYPLYILVITVDVMLSWYFNETTVRDRWAAIPYLVSMTQSWFYTATPGGSLVAVAFYRSSLCWSISTEFFLYLIYPIFGWLLARDKSSAAVRGVVAVAAVLILSYIVASLWRSQPSVNEFGVNLLGPHLPAVRGYDFASWLIFVSPYVRGLEFAMGMLVAHSFLSIQNSPPSKLQTSVITTLLGICVAYVAALLMPPSQRYPWIGELRETIGVYFALAFIIFGVARIPSSGIARFLSWPRMVQLGEYSYSIYLLQLFVFFVIANLVGMANPALPKIILDWSVLIFVSYLTYSFIERPARGYLRKLLTPKPWNDTAAAVRSAV